MTAEITHQSESEPHFQWYLASKATSSLVGNPGYKKSQTTHDKKNLLLSIEHCYQRQDSQENISVNWAISGKNPLY